MSDHIMFSYQWNIESLVSKLFFYLSKVQSIPLWMDKHGGMHQYLSASMAEGVEKCCVFVCFLTPEYQKSINCKRELTYALELHKPIIPCLIGSLDKTIKWKPSQWLGISITDLLYLNFSDIDENNFESKGQQLIEKINSILGITQSQQQSNIIEEEIDFKDFKISSSLILPPIIREGPQIRDEILDIILKKYSSEGDSQIRLINQSSDIECNQDFSQSLSIIQLSSEYEDSSNKWIRCDMTTTNKDEDMINIDPNKLVVCSLTIKIKINGSPGIDNEHRFRAHHLLPQPLRLKIVIEDTQTKHVTLIIEQVNRPLNLPRLDKLIGKLNIPESNLLGFVWSDDCSIDVRYFALIYYSNDENSLIKFSFGCDLSSLRSPSWDKQYVQTLQKTAKREGKRELIVHEGVFDPFIDCIALFDDHFKIEALRIKIKTKTSRTEQTIPLPINLIFTESQSF